MSMIKVPAQYSCGKGPLLSYILQTSCSVHMKGRANEHSWAFFHEGTNCIYDCYALIT